MPAHSDGRTVTRPPAPLPTASGLAPFAQRVAVAVLIVLLVGAVAYLMWQGIHVLLLAFAGVLFAVFLSALSDWLSEHIGCRYGLALTIVVVALFAFLGVTTWLLASHLAVQISNLWEQLPQSFARIRDYLEQYPLGQLLVERVPRAAEESLNQVGQFSRLTGLVSGVSSFLVAAVVIVFVGIFGAAEPRVYRSGVLHLVPHSHRRRAGEVLERVDYNLRWWLVGQAVLMVTMAVTTWLGLTLLGIPFALTLGLIAGVFELVPYVGPWLSVVPAALVALLVSPWHLVMTLVLYLLLHILEGYVMLPLVQRRAVHLPPALTLVVQLLMGELLGTLGLFVAAPLLVAVMVALKILYVEDTLGDETVDVPGEGEKENAVCEHEAAGTA